MKYINIDQNICNKILEVAAYVSKKFMIYKSNDKYILTADGGVYFLVLSFTFLENLLLQLTIPLEIMYYWLITSLQIFVSIFSCFDHVKINHRKYPQHKFSSTSVKNAFENQNKLLFNRVPW